jgi:ketosteroid isomerase-like protein
LSASIELVERIYEASATGDLGALMALAAADLVIQQDPALPWGGRYDGPSGVVEFFHRLAGTIDTSVTTEALFAAGDQVIQYGRSRGTVRSNGATYDIPECHIWTVVDDKVTDVRFFIDTPSMLEALAR